MSKKIIIEVEQLEPDPRGTWEYGNSNGAWEMVPFDVVIIFDWYENVDDDGDNWEKIEELLLIEVNKKL